MSCRHRMERTILEMSRAFPSHRHVEIWIVFAPDDLDRKIKRFNERQARAVSLQLLIELRAHLHEGRTGARRPHEIVGDERGDELLEMQSLVCRKRLCEFQPL